MKKYLFIIVSILMMACTSDFTEELTTNNTDSGTGFSINTNFYEVTTRATIAESKVKKIVYIVAKGDSCVKAVEQNYGDNGFGTISMDVSAGTYKLLIYASSATEPVVVNKDATITITKCRNAYSYSGDFTITKDKRTTVNANLTRCSSKITFKSVEDVPSDINNIRITLSGNTTQYNIATGEGITITSLDTEVLKLSDWIINSKFDINIFILLPNTESTVDATVTFYNNTDIKYQREYTNIPMKVNRETIVTAAMFHEHGVDGSTFTVNTDWENPYNIEF